MAMEIGEDQIKKCSACSWIWDEPGKKLFCRAEQNPELCEGPKEGAKDGSL